MKKEFRNFIPVIGIYFCFKYYHRLGKRTLGEFFDSEEMAIYHFFVLVLLLMLQFI
jgi:hypothetical protein